MSNTYKDLQNSHPCFGGQKNNVGRIHLPVSPGCNIACRFCDRVISDTENRPGVTSTVIEPEESIELLEKALNLCLEIRVAGIDEAKIEAVINEHEDYYYYLIERYADLFLENRVINNQFTVVADAQYTLGITKFLANDLGLVPAKQFIVDDTPKQYRDAITEEFKKLNYGIEAEVVFETDGYKIHNQIEEHDYHGYPLILGSYYEKELAESLQGNYLNISWPVQDKVVLDDFYVGYTGGIRLTVY